MSIIVSILARSVTSVSIKPHYAAVEQEPVQQVLEASVHLRKDYTRV